jgi:hypothetical protein
MLRRISKDHRENKQPSCEGQEIADHFLSILIESSSRAARCDAKARQLLESRAHLLPLERDIGERNSSTIAAMSPVNCGQDKPKRRRRHRYRALWR